MEKSFFIVSLWRCCVIIYINKKKLAHLDEAFCRYWGSKINQNLWILYDIACFSDENCLALTTINNPSEFYQPIFDPFFHVETQ